MAVLPYAIFLQHTTGSRVNYSNIAKQLHGLTPDQRLAAAGLRWAIKDGDLAWFAGDSDGGETFDLCCETLSIRPAVVLAAIGDELRPVVVLGLPYSASWASDRYAAWRTSLGLDSVVPRPPTPPGAAGVA